MENVWHSVISQLWTSDSVKQYNSSVNNFITLRLLYIAKVHLSQTLENVCVPINPAVREEAVMCETHCTALYSLRECKSLQ